MHNLTIPSNNICRGDAFIQNASKVIVGVVCGLVALTFVCVLALSPQNSVQAPVNSAPTASSGKASSQIPSSVPEANAKVTRYIIKSEGNSLCVYCEGEDAPIKTVELDVSALPPVDQELLEKGIRVSSKEDLNQLLEDLCS